MKLFKRRFSLIFTSLFVLLCIACVRSNVDHLSQTPHRAPNILLIVADDQGYADIEGRGANDVRTPNINKLAQSGISFTQAYATSPICNASRVGLITGQYQQRQGTYWYGGPGLHDETIPTIAQILQGFGYSNGYVGKFHYGKTVIGDSRRRDFPLNHGFDYFYGFEGGRKHYLNHKQFLEQNFLQAKSDYKRKGQSLAQGPMWQGRELLDQLGFSTELFGKQAIAFMKKNKHKPFFLQLSFNAVHNFTHQLPADYLAKHKLKGYRDWDPQKEDYRDWYVGSRYPNNPEGRAHYLGQLEYMDTELGKVLSYLENSGLRSNTLIIYISDNGGSTPIYANNTPLRGSKYTLYEGGIRIPMIISWPGHINKNNTSDEIVSTMDLLPTLCRFIASCNNVKSDGIDISSLLTGRENAVDREFLVWDTGHEIAVRQGDWKLKIAKESAKTHAAYEMVDIEIGQFLYNLKDDPSETKDLVKQFPEIALDLEKTYVRWKAGL